MTEEDYSKNLDPSEYYYYESEIADFYFYYPSRLFNSVEMDETPKQTAYGRNLRSICFYGSKGAELSYSVYERTENSSFSEITDRLHQNEKNQYYDISDILVKSDDEKGRIVMTGVADSNHKNVVYDLIKIDDKYVYRLLSLKPNYRSEEERVQYSYITENEYRMCGFSGSTKSARSYQEYLDSSVEQNNDSSTTNNHVSSFYGIWCTATKNYSDAEDFVTEMKSKGFDAQLIVTTDWSNLNAEKWYTVTAGVYSSEAEANRNLKFVKEFYPDAYVKFSGDYLVR